MPLDMPDHERKFRSDDDQSRWLLEDGDPRHNYIVKGKCRSDKISLYVVAIHLALLACNAGLFLLYLSGFRWNGITHLDLEEVKRPYSPALAGMQYTIQSINTHDPNDTFTGKPSLEIDQSWSNLLRSTTIRVTADELRALDQPSLALKDGSGYVGYVEVFHQLHCLKRMYQFQYPEVYSDLKAEGRLTLEHWDHCFQVLRKGIMCNADPTLNTFVPDPENPWNLRGISDGPRKCVDWERFEAWAHERAIGTDIHQLMKDGGYGEVGPVDVVAERG